MDTIYSKSIDTILQSELIKDTIKILLQNVQEKEDGFWIKILLALIPILGTIAAVIFGYLGIKKQIQANKETTEDNINANNENIKKQIKGNTEITFRQEWIDNLRDTLSKHGSVFNSIIKFISIYPLEKLTFNDKQEPSGKKLNEIYELLQLKRIDFNEQSYKLMLLINSDKDNHFDAYDLVLQIHSFISRLPLGDTDEIIKAQINQYILIKLCRIITINEWRKVQSDSKEKLIIVDLDELRKETEQEFKRKKL